MDKLNIAAPSRAHGDRVGLTVDRDRPWNDARIRQQHVVVQYIDQETRDRLGAMLPIVADEMSDIL
ncbi:hypothetical protein ACVWZR_005410 [Bradyrhizobium sp. i1.3.1]